LKERILWAYFLPTPGILSRLASFRRASWRRSLRQERKRRNHRLQAEPVMDKSSGQTERRSCCRREEIRPFSSTSSRRLRQSLLSLRLSSGKGATCFKHLLGEAQALLHGQQVQDEPHVQAVGLGGGGEGLAEAGQLEVVHVEELVSGPEDLLVQGAGMAPVSLHGHLDLSAPAVMLHPLEEAVEALAAVGDDQLLQDLSLGGGYPHMVGPCSHIDSHVDAFAHAFLLVQGPAGHPERLVYHASHFKAPSRRHLPGVKGGGGISGTAASLAGNRGPQEPHLRLFLYYLVLRVLPSDQKLW